MPFHQAAVIGAGSWGTALAKLLSDKGCEVHLWAHRPEHAAEIVSHRENRTYLPGVETNTGPLGHGLPVAVGIAVAGQIDKADYRVFALTGDGELQEGSMWEAAMFAGHRGLGNLTVIVDRNRLQQGAGTEDTNSLEPLADKWRAFGWDVAGVDGHDHAALLETFDRAAQPRSKPLVVIADTHKGQGVSFMRDQAGWHHGVPNPEQYTQAIAELEAEMN